MEIIRCEQGSEEWEQARLGKVTASNFSLVLAGGEDKSRKGYMEDLVTEIDEGVPTEHICTKYMKAGIEKEPLAREEYEYRRSVKVEQVGFVKLNDYIGGSPDGLVGEDGILEIKCPTAKVHRHYWDKTTKPCKAYRDQMQGLLWITGRKWCDFVSFRPESKSCNYWERRYTRDEKYIKVLEIALITFVIELKEMIDRLMPKDF